MPAKIAFNPYEVLGIERGCTEKEIQKAYRQQCLRWHPDKNLDNKEEAEKRFITAKEAFKFLFEKEKRVEYDREYERAQHRDAHQRARMAQADSVRRKLIDDLHQREKDFANNRTAEEHLTPSQLHHRKREEVGGRLLYSRFIRQSVKMVVLREDKEFLRA
ncbi:unnamed protein product [Heligmosomoides polygyrus]|uniref:J domain-containing protein n=1 Tax=Heligmosomoides polygyrus TaxID=6339 RepID=A0A183G9R7_HELPZ|nr:unnamed protein product [Heligmosomoides polygyrus]